MPIDNLRDPDILSDTDSSCRVRPTIKISVVSTGKYVIPYFLSDFMNTNKGVDLILDVTNKSTVVKHLENNEVDFALVSVVPQHLNLNKVQLMQNKLFLTASTRYDFSTKSSKAKMFEEYPLIYREEGSATRNAMETFIAKNSLPTQKKMTLTSNEALKQALIAGLGLSIMPIIGIKNALQHIAHIKEVLFFRLYAKIVIDFLFITVFIIPVLFF